MVLKYDETHAVEPLIAACQKRNRLRFLQPWLEARFDEGEQVLTLLALLVQKYKY